MKVSLSILILSLCYTCAHAQSESVGVFTHNEDIGNPKLRGDARYDAATKTYFVKGAGYNIWFARDEFRYLYKELSGDFILRANFQFVGTKGNAHRKMGWMIRESNDEAAASINACVHADGLVVLQWRPLKGDSMRDPEGEIFFPKKEVYQVIEMERKGNDITMKVGHPGEPLQLVGTHAMPNFRDPVLAGLFISPHDEGAIEEMKVWNVTIEASGKKGKKRKD
jgi:hypothetical protein